jgi:hypothetical protein
MTDNLLVILYVFVSVPLALLCVAGGLLLVPRPRRRVGLLLVVLGLIGIAILIPCFVGIGLD